MAKIRLLMILTGTKGKEMAKRTLAGTLPGDAPRFYFTAITKVHNIQLTCDVTDIRPNQYL
jgi:hypothetical protein